MNVDRHRRAKEIFLAACDLPPDRRSSYLDEACGEADLRAEVRALLKLDRPAAKWRSTPSFPMPRC